MNKRRLCLAALLWDLPAAARAENVESSGGLRIFGDAAELARSTQPEWSSPLVTTTGLMEQRFRFDVAEQHSGNGVSTTALDGGRGLDLIVSQSSEIQIGLPPYDNRTAAAGSAHIAGFSDWPFIRLERRLASGSNGDGAYVLTTWLQIQAPAGSAALTTHAWTFAPTIAFGKGWNDLDVQGTISAVLPGSHTQMLGWQMQSNMAVQYHLLTVLWPEIETNWTWFASGQRAGLNQLYLTTGIVAADFE